MDGAFGQFVKENWIEIKEVIMSVIECIKAIIARLSGDNETETESVA